MKYRDYIDMIVIQELSEIKEDCILFQKLCEHIAEQHDIPLTNIRCSVNRLYITQGFIKRRLTDSFKKYYQLDIKGYPQVLIKE